MAADYTEEQQTAYEMILENGGMFKFVTPGETAADPDKPWDVEDAAETTLEAPAVYFYENGARTIYIAAKDLAEELNDDMEIRDVENVSWAFIEGSLEKLDPAGTGQTIIYQARIRAWPR